MGRRIKMEISDYWPYEVTSLSRQEILKAVDDATWQTFRLSLKGLTTQEKLQKLADYRNIRTVMIDGKDVLPRVVQVRIDNYINALLREGQLVRVGPQILIRNINPDVYVALRTPRPIIA